MAWIAKGLAWLMYSYLRYDGMVWHRIELHRIVTYEQIQYINDSKATMCFHPV